MKTEFGIAIRTASLMLLITGVAYPLILVAIGQIVFPYQANGSLVQIEGRTVGSELIGQDFKSPKFFHSRTPVESASGLDPHITPHNAFSQIANVSRATGIPEDELRKTVDAEIQRNKIANLEVFAEEHVNVLRLNLELMKKYPQIYAEFLSRQG
ncbi:MAG: potassium-transporting ATPase subunit C [Thaumarchaeota archaeon]|nr:potassium-transporting ATPase subunit C [Nitrososphaerota archaeon]